MGKTAFSGPVYGAKSLLWTITRDNVAISTAAQTLRSIVLPTYEDWYVTEFRGWRGSTGSTDFTLTLTDDSTAIANVTSASSAAGIALSTTLTPDAGEYEGVRVAAGSSLSVTMQNGNSSAVGSSDVAAAVYGYIRFINSTRPE